MRRGPWSRTSLAALTLLQWTVTVPALARFLLHSCGGRYLLQTSGTSSSSIFLLLSRIRAIKQKNNHFCTEIHQTVN